MSVTIRASRLLACALIAFILPAVASAANDTLVYRVTARIDGSNDLLILRRNTVQWHHANTVAAPGLQGGNNDPTTISASLNGAPTMTAVAWLPTWSQPFPNDIRFDDFSSTYTGLTPALPAVTPLSVDVTTASGRGTVTLEQLPTPANDYTLIAKFADGFNGSAFLEGQITVVVPEPATTAMLFALPLCLATRRRRTKGQFPLRRIAR